VATVHSSATAAAFNSRNESRTCSAAALIVLDRQYVVGLFLDYQLGISRWQPSRRWSPRRQPTPTPSVILVWPDLVGFFIDLALAQHQAVTLAQPNQRCTSFFLPVSRVPHKSCRRWLPPRRRQFGQSTTQSTKPFSISSGSNRSKHPVKVSCDGIQKEGSKTSSATPAGLAVVRHVVPTLAPLKHRRYGDKKNLFK